ncbi:hypothetical protein F5Y16DRAFT_382924 [Xylariaceae sp. FL0255]|nr:hypothetical protein F5Y16DRAFT_382924 [Xylariaceae sp. FL0255]
MMHLMRWPSLLATFVVLASAHPVSNDTLVGARNGAPCWYRYCADDVCTVNCGHWLQISDPTCWNEYPRKSIQWNGSPYGAYALITSPKVGCPCQNGCLAISKWGLSSGCYNITEFYDDEDQSFRFISGGCPKNQC